MSGQPDRLLSPARVTIAVWIGLLIATIFTTPVRAADDLSGAHDFDFEFGEWIVHHRVKRASGEWY
jgi:hypothetical protein